MQNTATIANQLSAPAPLGQDMLGAAPSYCLSGYRYYSYGYYYRSSSYSAKASYLYQI
ncbi:hypothetical protein [Pontibacter harenae]|uniref:hypothetical protein n=1 Tax=Pontibacter harenae TaxID=2894083 RepID=UPI001E4C3DC4|nr:hypothetical protein [Pontibacter harenae]MCC9168722.1 hypothetical protein [Pontibacter harenae]